MLQVLTETYRVLGETLRIGTRVSHVVVRGQVPVVGHLMNVVGTVSFVTVAVACKKERKKER